MVLHADFRFEPWRLLAAGASSFFFSFSDQDRTCSACDFNHVLSSSHLSLLLYFGFTSLFFFFSFFSFSPLFLYSGLRLLLLVISDYWPTFLLRASFVADLNRILKWIPLFSRWVLDFQNLNCLPLKLEPFSLVLQVGAWLLKLFVFPYFPCGCLQSKPTKQTKFFCPSLH